MPSSITLTVKHLPTSTSFFLSALQPLDYVYRGRVDNTIGFGLKDSPPDFWISQETPGVPAGAAHVAFPAGSQKIVNDFFIAAIKAGGKCHGEPALRDQKSGYFSAAIIDFDGNSIEAVYRPDLLDEGYGSRPSSVSSVSSVKKPSMASKAPTMVSKASTAKPPATEVKSVAPSQASKAPSQAPSKAPTTVSKAPTSASKSPTQVSKSPTQVSRAPTAAPAPSQVSRAPTQASRAPTQVSRAPSGYAPSQVAPSQYAPSQYAPSQAGVMTQAQPQTVTHTTPSGEVVTTLVTEARGAISLAKELVNTVRPALDSANSAPNLPTSSSPPSDPNSHKPSDTIVGTLLGVAAGAALHYAYTKASEGDKKREAELAAAAAANRPGIGRTATEPSFANGQEQMYYYREYTNQPYAIEAPPSEYGTAYGYEPSRVGSQRYITMEDNAERLSDYAPSQRPRRRSSFSGVDVRSFASQSRASANPKSSGKLLEAPPTAYRAPTAITQAETDSHASGRSKSRLSSMVRANSVGGDSKHSRRSSRRGSDEDLRSSASRRTSGSKRAPSEASTVKPIKPSAVSVASTSKPSSRAPSRTGTSRPEDTPLPSSRAGTTVSGSPSEYHSTHSKTNKTVIGKMIDRERTGGRSELTRSVVGKIQDSEKLNLPDREVDPSDSVSQVSSVRSHKTSHRKSR